MAEIAPGPGTAQSLVTRPRGRCCRHRAVLPAAAHFAALCPGRPGRLSGRSLVDTLARRGLSRTLGVVLVFLVFTALVVAAMILAVPMLLHQLDLLVAKIPAIYTWFAQEALPWAQQKFNLTLERLPRLDWSGQLADHWQSLGKMTARTLVKVSGSGASCYWVSPTWRWCR